MNNIRIYKGKINDIIKQIKEDIENEKRSSKKN